MYKQQAQSNSTEFDYYKSWHWKMSAASQPSRRYKKEDEAFYFADVDGTRTQLTKEQLEAVKAKYDIPISTKIVYAINEQILSLLTGTKPYPKLLSASENELSALFTEVYEAAFNGVWYESETNEEFTLALRDCINVGEGYLHVRKANFYNESTFNVIHEYVPWQYVYIDPNAKKNDYSDAEMMCIARIISRKKAENEFDMKIPDTDLVTKDNGWGMGVEFGELDLPYYTWTSQYEKGSDAYVWTREFYEKKNTWIYIDDNGDVGSKRPVPIEIPNQEKIALGQQLEQLQQQYNQIDAGGQEAAQRADQMDDLAARSAAPLDAVNLAGSNSAEADQSDQQAQQLIEQIKEMTIAFAQMPDMVPAYRFFRLTGEESTTFNYEKVKEKHIVRTFCVGNRIVDRDILMTDEYPIVPFSFAHNKSPNRVYGITHFIKDIAKALNKFWSIVIYDAQLHGQRKVLMEESTVADKDKWQNDWAMPGAVLTYKSNPTINDGGKPTILEPAPLNQAYTQLLTLLQQLAEYITGIYAALQGNTQPNMPETNGGIQSLQAAGGQRIKLYSRFFEVALQKLTYVTVCYLQQYAPRDVMLKYFDENGDGKEVQIMNGGNDLRFKVRVQLTTNLPTTRLMASQLLASVSGQTRNPAVADLLTREMIKNLDMPNSREMLENLDTVKMLQSQLEQLQQQLDASQKRINMMENNQYSSDLAAKAKMAQADMQNQMDMNVKDHELELQKQQIDQGLVEF